MSQSENQVLEVKGDFTDNVVTVPVAEQQPKWRCPKCGRTDLDKADLTIEFVSGLSSSTLRICLCCYAEWVRQNIPQMVEVPDAE